MSLRKKWRHVGRRDWSVIVDEWLPDIPHVDPPGSKPDPGVESLATLLAAYKGYESIETVADVEGLRRNVLWEAVYLLHKAAHVVRAAQSHANIGLRSWALFESYHGAYLSAKAVLGFLGIAVPRLQGQQALIDLFPADFDHGRKVKKVALVRERVFRYVALPQLDQRYLWELLQRVLKMSTVACWTQSFADAIVALNWEAISRARNPYIYSSPFWPLDDLHEERIDAAFGRTPEKDDAGNLELVESDATFLLELAFTTQQLGIELLQALAQKTPALTWDVERLTGEFYLQRNSLLVSFVQEAR